MQLHELKKEYKTKKSRRVGRGGKRGTFSGHGTKGQRSRAGANIRPAIRDFVIKLPKRRGFKFKTLKEKPEIINLEKLTKFFKDGEIVSFKSLTEKGLLKTKSGKKPAIKILGKGESSRKLQYQGVKFSKRAKEKVSR